MIVSTYKLFISNSLKPFAYAKKRIVKPHQRCSDPTLVFLSLFFMYFSRKKTHGGKSRLKNGQFYFLVILQSSRGNFSTKNNRGSKHKFCARRGYRISINVRFSHDFEHLSLC